MLIVLELSLGVEPLRISFRDFSKYFLEASRRQVSEYIEKIADDDSASDY